MLDQQYKTILVPIDGSKQANLALQKAMAVAKRNGSMVKLYILHVIDPRLFKTIGAFDQSMVEEIADNAKVNLNEYVELAKSEGILNVEYLLEFGVPKNIIAKEIPNKVKADLIIIGATGLGTVERVFIGSVTDYVIRTASVDVLVVKQ